MPFAKIFPHASDSPAIYHVEGSISYSDFREWVRIFTAHLRKAGVQRGDFVGIVSENNIELALFFPVLWQIGAIAVPISPRFPETQISMLLKNSACSVLLISEKCLNISTKNPAKSLFRYKKFSTGDIPAPLFQKMKTTKPLNFWDQNIFAETLQTEVDLNHLATVIFTSGSGGMPKGALHSLGNHYYSALGSNQNIVFGPGDRWLLSLPLYHVGGLAILMRAWLGGGAVTLPSQEVSLENALAMPGLTHLSLVATQLFWLMKNDVGRKKLAGLKAILLGGSAIPTRLIQEAAALNLPIHTSYGSTEMSSQITTTPPNASWETLLTSGKLLPHRQFKIASDGEILVRGKTCFQGYFESGKLKPAHDENGWFHTGDRGKTDSAGRLLVIGRKDNMFISGGENIQPEAIEKTLSRISGIRRCIVVPVKNAEFGMRPAAFVETATGAAINKNRLRTELLKTMAKFNIPDYFFPWPKTLPESGLKINRAFFKMLAAEQVNNFRRENS